MERIEERTEHIRCYPELILIDSNSSCLSFGDEGVPRGIMEHTVRCNFLKFSWPWMDAFHSDEIFASWECFPSL